MPRLTKANAFDRWIDQFSDWGIEDQEFALAQAQGIHRQTQRAWERAKAAKNGIVAVVPANPPSNSDEQSDIPLEETTLPG